MLRRQRPRQARLGLPKAALDPLLKGPPGLLPCWMIGWGLWLPGATLLLCALGQVPGNLDLLSLMA